LSTLTGGGAGGSAGFAPGAAGRRRGRRRGTPREALDHVGLGDAAFAAAAGDLGRVDRVLIDELPGRRHEPRVGARGGGLGRRRGRHRHRLGPDRGRGRGRRPGLGVERRDDLARSDRAAVGLDDLDEHAVGRGRQLEHDLVGLDVDEVLVALDRLARLLVPGEQRRLRNRFGQLRHLHFDQHVYPSLRRVFRRARLSSATAYCKNTRA
jgi:hypothetical protein